MQNQTLHRRNDTRRAAARRRGEYVSWAGQRLLESAESIAAAESSFLREVEEMKQRDRPLIRIRAGEWVSRSLSLAMSRLQAAASHCDITLATQGWIDDDSIEANDIVIRETAAERAGLVRKLIGTVEYAAMANKDYHAQRRAEDGESIFQTGTWALWCRIVDHGQHLQEVRGWGYPQIGGKARVILCNSVQVMLNMIQSGSAYGFLPMDIGRRAGLSQGSERVADLRHDYWLCFPEGARRKKAVLAVAREVALTLQKQLCA